MDDHSPIVNAMTIDVEDYFHANALSAAAPVSSWPSLESRVVRNNERLLEMFAEAGITDVPSLATSSARGTGQRAELSCARSIKSPSIAVAVGSDPAPLPNKLKSPEDTHRR